MIKCVAIDDEPIALSIISEYCRRSGGIELECFTSPEAGMERIAVWEPDIVFLDIEMQSYNGLELARKLPPSVCLIFTTAYSDYALQGFNADAVDFLHKPIFYPRFEQALRKAAVWLGSTRQQPRQRETITLKVEHKTVIVDLADIIYVEAMDNYVKIFRRDLPMVLSQIPLKQVASMLPSDRFVRVHRSFIVALNAIDGYSNRVIYLIRNYRVIPVGRKYARDFNNAYNSLTPDNSEK